MAGPETLWQRVPDVLVVDMGVKGGPLRQSNVRGPAGGVDGAVLAAPAELFAVGLVAEVVDGHEGVGEVAGEVPGACGGGVGGAQDPAAGRGWVSIVFV